MKAINLLDRQETKNARKAFENWKLEKGKEVSEKSQKLGLKKGDVVEFFGGFSNHLRYITEILGFDNETGKAYMLWDCYWFPVDLEKREVKKV